MILFVAYSLPDFQRTPFIFGFEKLISLVAFKLTWAMQKILPPYKYTHNVSSCESCMIYSVWLFKFCEPALTRELFGMLTHYSGN